VAAAADEVHVRLSLRLIVAVMLVAATPAAQPPAGPPHLVLVVVVDGLRPDSINADDTPTIARLKDSGVEFLNSHSVFPTVTRVNTAALVTGSYPDAAGIVGNVMFVAGVNEKVPFNTGDYRPLLKLEEATGRAVTAPTLGEVLQARGRTLVTISSGSTGNGFLLNPQARHGAGVAINGMFERGVTAAYPQSVSDAILQRFGAPPADGTENVAVTRMEWTDTVLRDYVLPELKPDVVIDWEEGVDATQHAFGVGSPQAKYGLKHVDASIGRTLERIVSLGLRDRTDVILTSDHGFARHAATVNVTQSLVDAGVKVSHDSTDVIIASDGEALLFYVENHAPERIARLAQFLLKQPWADVVFTAPGQGKAGHVPGTFSLDLIHASHPTRAADVVISMVWSDDPNEFGARGSHTVNTGGGANGHGGLNPWLVHNTLLATGPDFKQRTKISAPAAIPDIAPTILATLGITDAREFAAGTSGGRVLRESLKDGPSEESLGVVTGGLVIGDEDGRGARVTWTTAVGHDYVDSGKRIR
jgi:predicted AlkP superfamily pyrophosphatase or phosphodiesterase